jgi:type IV pilus assembly protein PilB
MNDAFSDVSGGLAQFTARAQQLGASGIDARLAGALLYRNLVSEDQLSTMIADATANQRPFSSIVAASGLSQSDRLEAQAIAAGVPYIDLEGVGIPPTVISMLRPETANAHQAVTVRLDEHPETGERTIWVALAKPASMPARHALEQFFAASDIQVSFCAAHPEKIEEILSARYQLMTGVEEIEGEEAMQPEDLADEIAQGPARQYFSQLLMDAVARRASDLHFEIAPDRSGLIVRARVDGVMHEMMVIAERHRLAVMAVLKLEMEGMDVSDNRRLQNGRFTKRINGKEVDFRGATYLTVNGEEMVVRLLDKEGLTLDLQDMGMSDYNYARFREAFMSSSGAVIICGPTGPERTILTIEDPVEYKLAGISQAPVVTELDRTFASTLRNALRCDPDVIMVGEIRDEDTAAIAMRAAISGHLVLSTLHAAEAALAPIQLTQMGTPAYQVADALRVVVGQRLCRRLCEHCRVRYIPEPEELMLLGYSQEVAVAALAQADQYPLHKPNREGCNFCTHGYKGRTALHEVLIVGDHERELLLSSQGSAYKLRDMAVERGMKTIKQDGVDKVFRGITSFLEVKRVVA